MESSAVKMELTRLPPPRRARVMASVASLYGTTVQTGPNASTSWMAVAFAVSLQ